MAEPEERKPISERVRDMIAEIESNLRKLKTENATLKEQLRQAEFERDEWRKVADA